jgi:hypothetical protein
MSDKKKIKVVLGSNIKREAEMIDPRGGSVIATGSTGAQIAKKLYGRR